VYCAGNDQTFIFIQNILSEIVELFPSRYIHIGADECPKIRWSNCAKCQARIKSENLKNEFELQTYFVNRICQYLTTKNKVVIAWDEVLEGGIEKLAPNVIIQAWRSTEAVSSACRANRSVISSPTSHCYLDANIASTDLRKIYEFDPCPHDLNNIESRFVFGAECNMWTEDTPQNLVDSKVFPRILGLAEVLWSHKSEIEIKVNQTETNLELDARSVVEFVAFLLRCREHKQRLRHMGVDIGPILNLPSIEMLRDKLNKI